jgi:hypothetical protein
VPEYIRTLDSTGVEEGFIASELNFEVEQARRQSMKAEVGAVARECAVSETKTDCRRLVPFHHVRILATGKLTITRLSEELWKNIGKHLADYTP